MLTQAVLDRQRVGESIVSSARTHAEDVGNRLNEELAVILTEGETLPDFVTLQHQLARYLEMRTNALVAADEVHLQELDDDKDPRLRRDEAAEVLLRKLIEIRETLVGVFGAERAAALVGIEGETARDPLRLYRLASRTLERLQAPEPELPPIRVNGVQLDPVLVGQDLQPFLDNLRRAIGDVTRELRETETTLNAKTEALEAYDRAVRGIGRILKGCNELADFPKFAEKIRLTRPGRSSTGGEEEPQQGPEQEEGPAPPGPEAGDEIPAKPQPTGESPAEASQPSES